MIIVLMGVTGSGKTTVGKLLSRRLDWKYYDADDFHPSANVEKMRRGMPLDDGDRKPWLESLRTLISDRLARDENAVLACSALKEAYRRRLLIDDRVKLVFLNGAYHLIEKRLRKRRRHYMSPQLLDSQFATLEPPQDGIEVNISSTPDKIAGTIIARLELPARNP